MGAKRAVAKKQGVRTVDVTRGGAKALVEKKAGAKILAEARGGGENLVEMKDAAVSRDADRGVRKNRAATKSSRKKATAKKVDQKSQGKTSRVVNNRVARVLRDGVSVPRVSRVRAVSSVKNDHARRATSRAKRVAEDVAVGEAAGVDVVAVIGNVSSKFKKPVKSKIRRRRCESWSVGNNGPSELSGRRHRRSLLSRRL